MERLVIKEFIEIYKNEPSLWKTNSAHYNNKDVKQAAYCRLAEKLKEIYPNADINLVKKKINALRTNFRKEFRKVQQSKQRCCSGLDEDLYVPTLWYYDLFYFIADQEIQKGNASSDCIDVEEMLHVDLDENMHYEVEEEDEYDDDESPRSESSKAYDSSLAHSSNFHNSRVSERQSVSKRKREDFSEERFESEIYADFTNHSSQQDDFDVFGRYVASKIRKMSKSMQLLSERLISEVLFLGQMGLLNRYTTLRVEDNSSADTD